MINKKNYKKLLKYYSFDFDDNLCLLRLKYIWRSIIMDIGFQYHYRLLNSEQWLDMMIGIVSMKIILYHLVIFDEGEGVSKHL